jgi:DNA-binding IclR family transcriptional regulator
MGMPMPETSRPVTAADPVSASDDRGGVKSARRTTDLLEAFASSPEWMSLAELHVLSEIPRSSLHGLLRTLAAAQWIETDATGAKYRLGVKALICGTAYLDRDPAVPYATEVLESLREQTGFTSHFARRNSTEVVYLETRESRRSIHLISRVGRTLPAYATALGKALLAELTDDEVARLVPADLPAMTPNTITSRAALLEQLSVVRELGYASEREEGTLGVRCVGAAVKYRIPATDALSCSLPASVSDDKAVEVGELLVAAATELGSQLQRAGIR